MKRTVLVLALILSITSGIMADTSGQILLNGTVSAINSIVVVDAGTSLSDLGGTAYDTKIGDITINNNNSNGFKLTFTSANNGFLITGSGSTDSTKIIYQIDLVNRTGTIGSGISEPTILDIQPVSSPGIALNYSASSTSPTSGLKYDVNINTATKGLEAGSYSDTLTIDIANL